jgi:hypothetical protein
VQTDDPIWTLLRNRVVQLFSPLGVRYEHGHGDWYILDEDTGQHMVKIELVNNDLLRPPLVASLHALLTGYPDWAIALQIDVTDEAGTRRGMGLWIQEDKVYDELQREYLPAIFQDMRF